jgi:hypothetical protein
MTRLPTPLADAFVADIFATFTERPLKVRFVYNGGGDDGWFDDFGIEFPDSIDISGWYTGHILSTDYKPYNDEHVVSATTKRARAKIIGDIVKKHDINAIYNELGGILCGRHPGWEINDGGSGAFIHSSDGTRRHEHTTNVMDTIEEENPY